MSSYKVRDFYSAEAVRQVETTNALQSQLELKLQQLTEWVAKLPEDDRAEFSDFLRGYRRAIEDLTHSAGTSLAQLYREEKFGLKAQDSHD